MINLLYIDLFCGAGGTSTGVNEARLHGEQKKFIGNAVHTSIPKAWCPTLSMAINEHVHHIVAV